MLLPSPECRGWTQEPILCNDICQNRHRLVMAPISLISNKNVIDEGCETHFECLSKEVMIARNKRLGEPL